MAKFDWTNFFEYIFFDYTFFNFIFSVIAAIIYLFYGKIAFFILGTMLLTKIILKFIFGKLKKEYMYFYFALTLIFSVLAFVFIVYAGGRIDNVNMKLLFVPLYPFSPLLLLNSFKNTYNEIVPALFCILLSMDILMAVLLKEKRVIAVCGLCAVFASVCACIYVEPLKNIIESQKDDGYGFEFMHGHSSTDFTGYHVYDSKKLAVLDHEPDFIIENPEDMPVLDGAEACYPLYTAAAKAVYKNIDQIEDEYADTKENGRIVTFTNTKNAYYRLIFKEADIVFGARPSAKQIERATEKNEKIDCTVIGKEAFVFFVEKDSPISDVTEDELRDIYSGKITNWKELGGKNQEIVAFQRPENSGSQVVMKYFMGDTQLMEPVGVIDWMSGTISKVAEYEEYPGAIGYSFRYFVEELYSEKEVKILSVNGVYPTIENIENGTYPILAEVVCAKLESNNKPNVQKMIDFMLSDDGKQLIRQTGYAPVSE